MGGGPDPEPLGSAALGCGLEQILHDALMVELTKVHDGHSQYCGCSTLDAFGLAASSLLRP